MKQYEIWLARLAPPIGSRPVLLLTRDVAYRYLTRVTVVEITTKPRYIPQEVSLSRRDGLVRASVARFDNIASVPKTWLVRRLGRLAPGREHEVKRAVGYAFDWEELVRL